MKEFMRYAVNDLVPKRSLVSCGCTCSTAFATLPIVVLCSLTTIMVYISSLSSKKAGLFTLYDIFVVEMSTDLDKNTEFARLKLSRPPF